MEDQRSPITMKEVSDPLELARAREQRRRFDRNSAWLERHISEVYSEHRGKFVCIAAEQLFVGDTAEEVIARATTAYPEDDGWFTRYIPKERVPRIYAI